MTKVTVLDVNGRQIQPRRASALAGGGLAPYDAADVHGEHLGSWRPALWSPDIEVNPYRDRIVARVRDLVRNDGWASGGVTRILDNAIGGNFRPVSKPDYRALAAATGIKAFDAVWAEEFGTQVEAHWRSWAIDPGRYSDLQRSMTIPQMFRVGFRHKLVDGDALAISYWRPDRVEPGRARYATCMQLIDPDRLSNPNLQFDLPNMRGGVEIDADGAAVAYHIRAAHQGDWFVADKTVTWQRLERETKWGRPIVVHDFDRDRASTHRGGAGIFAPILTRLRMLAKYDQTELDAAIINAIFGAYIESPFDPQTVQDALGDTEELMMYQNERAKFHEERRIALGNSRMPHLFPGEKIETVAAERPSSNFKDFEAASLRNIAAGIGVSAQQLSNDWSDVNYSSARAAMLEIWKTMTRRRTDFGVGFGQGFFDVFLEESMAVDDLPLPAGAPEYFEHRAGYGRVTWMGPGRGYVDPVAEKQGAILGLDACLTTLEQEVAESSGEDYIDFLDQRAREIEAMKKRNIPPPQWVGMDVGLKASTGQAKDAQQTITAPSPA